MRKGNRKSGSGFTLLEMIVSMAVGLIVLAGAVTIYSQAMNASYQISQRSEMQQNARAGIDVLARDISLAGYGLPYGGVQLPLGGTGNSIYACGASGCYTGYASGSGPSGLAFPTIPAYGANAAIPNVMYGLMAGYRKGISITSSSTATDVITMTSVDPSFPLNTYPVTCWATNGTSITLSTPTGSPALNNSTNGVQVGDLILLSITPGDYAVGEVTNVTATQITFADSDTMNINQSGATSGNIKSFLTNAGTCGAPLATITAQRLLLTTYYIDIPRGADGTLYTSDDGPPRLMKQINAQAPVPVAENIMGLSVSYDVADSNGNVTAALRDGGLGSSPPISPAQIIKVNLSMSARSPMKNATGRLSGYQTMTVQTSVGARDMSYRDRYQ